MNWKMGIFAALAAGSLAFGGCSGCSDEETNNGANNGNNGSNNGNNGSNNGSNNGNNGSNNGMTVIDCSETQDLELATITEDTTIIATDGPCYVSDGIDVREGVLTIEPGVTILFNENALVHVRENGRLNAVGTQDKPITFSTERDVPGYWQGIKYDRSNSIDNVLEWVIVQYAGGQQDAALVHDNCCGGSNNLAVRNTVIEQSASLGFYAAGGSTLGDFSSNTMRNNVRPAYFHATTVHFIGEDNDFSGNTTDTILIGGEVDSEVVWPAPNVPYEVNDDISVRGEGFLTISAGSTFMFQEGLGISSNQASSFQIAGEAGNEVLMTGTEKMRGFWKGINIDKSDSTDNVFSHLIVEYAGNESPGGITWDSCCGIASTVAFDNVTVRESSSYGFSIRSPMASSSSFTGIVSTANTSGAMIVSAPWVQSLQDGDFTGNDVDVIAIEDGNLDGDHVWVNPGVPYRALANINVRADSSLTLAPGTVIEFDENLELAAAQGAWVNAVGTSDDPIVFRGVVDTPDYWTGVVLDRTTGVSNELGFLEIHNGGGNGADAALSMKACCGIESNVALNNITLRAAHTGLFVADSATLTLTGCMNISGSELGAEVGGAYTTFADLQAACQ